MTEFEDYEAAAKELAALNEMPDTSRDDLRAKLEAYLAEKKRGFVLWTTKKTVSSPKVAVRRRSETKAPTAKSAAHPWRKAAFFGRDSARIKPT